MSSGVGGWFLRQLPGLAVVAMVGGFVYFATLGERMEVERRQQSERAEQASRAAIFARGKLGEMLTLCKSGWENLDFSAPVALAWTRQGVDAYFHQGSDSSTLRRVRCDANGVVVGPRFNHPLHEQLPAEAPTETEQETTSWLWGHAVEEESSKSLDASEVAVELLKHPVTGRVLTRRWRAGAEGAMAVVEPADAPPFAVLLSPGQVHPLPGAAPPAAVPIPRRRWTVETEAAFAFLEKTIPKAARISELRFEDDKIEVRIEHPTPAFGTDPPAPYGDKNFDEYGTADLDWWYPRTDATFGCAQGRPLQEVHALFLAANTGGRLAWAWYSCSTAFSNGRDGVWHLVPAS